MLLLAAAGGLILLTAWLPMVLRALPLSVPMACLGAGALGFWASGIPAPLPTEFPNVTERLTEVVVLVALTGAGLKLDRRIGWRRWGKTWLLLAVAMPLSIIGIALVGHWVLGFGLAAALLLGAALAPTDPVLAGDVQVGPPGSGEEDEVRFTLTAEAGLNDALAFPFVHLALLVAVVGLPDAVAWGEWFAVKVLWKLALGVAMGWLAGRALAWVIFRLPPRAALSGTREGFVALGMTFVAYALTEMAGGYGFLAVFVSALMIRDAERDHEFHTTLHEFTDQAERLLMMAVLAWLGGALVSGLLAPLGWLEALAAALILLVVRPLAGLVALAPAQGPWSERAAIAFFGIRGLGSLYYAGYALSHMEWAEGGRLWAVLGLVVLGSVLMHGLTVNPAMRWLDARRRVRPGPAP